MNKFLLLTFCVLMNGYTNSQNLLEWAPIGAKWTYSLPINYGNALSYLTIESVSDTIILDIPCKVLTQKCLTDPSFNRDFYTYRSEDSVWLFDGSVFRLLYNFGALAGEEWDIYGPEINSSGLCDTVTYALTDSIGVEELNGNNYRYLFVSFQEFGWQFNLCNSTENKISEKFGSYGYMFPQDICLLDAPYPCELRCYEDSEFGLFKITQYDSCTFQYGVGVNEIGIEERIKIYPNPVVNELYIETVDSKKIGTISIYSSSGQFMYIQECNNSTAKIEIHHLKNGYYFLKVLNDNVIINSKIVKM